MVGNVTVSEEVKKKMEKRKDKVEDDLQLKFTLEDAFNDTCRQCKENPALVQSVEGSIAGQQIITQDAAFAISKRREGRIRVTRSKTLAAAAAYVRKGHKVAVLNFGSAFMPGGGGHKNSLTQEECLCRESTLYPCISDSLCMEQFYGPHREGFQYAYWSVDHSACLYNDDMIYTPGVTVFKTSDKMPELMPVDQWFNIDVITAAAPNVKGMKNMGSEPVTKQMTQLFEDRFARILIQAAEHQADVLILGAFGCGEFGNDPMVVAAGAARALEKFKNAFDTVEFAIYETGSKKRFHAFRMVLDRYLNESQV